MIDWTTLKILLYLKELSRTKTFKENGTPHNCMWIARFR